MRISDWSSDVCSSDLVVLPEPRPARLQRLGCLLDVPDAVLRLLREVLQLSAILAAPQSLPGRDAKVVHLVGKKVLEVEAAGHEARCQRRAAEDRKSTRLNSSH